MKKHFAVIGYPLGHTMSPFIHNRLFQLNGIDGEYQAILTHPDELKNTVGKLSKFDGFNITIPHKEALVDLVDELDKTAKIYGAVNTVANKGGKLVGYSTDADGFKAALELEDIPLKGDVLVCGAGGVSRTIATECVRCGLNVTLAVRQSGTERAKKLANDLEKDFSAKVAVITYDQIEKNYDLLVNGTPVGMYPNENASILNEEQLKHFKYVFDSVYNPEQTCLIKLAQKLNIKAVSGMGMLVMQAAKAQEHWFGVTFEKEDMKQLISDANEQMRRIFNE